MSVNNEKLISQEEEVVEKDSNEGGIVEETGTPEDVFGSPKSEKTKAFLNNAVNLSY